MNRLLLFLFLLHISLLAGCTFAPSTKDVATADYGLSMTASEMHSKADQWLVHYLKDPESRRVEWVQSGKAWVWGGLVGGGHKFGYGSSAFVNAKNSFGGYTGSKPYFFFFRDGELIWAGEMSSDVCGFVKE